MDSIATLQAKRNRIFAREADQLLVLRTQSGERWYRLNHTGAFFAHRLARGVPVETIIAEASQRWAIPAEQASTDLTTLSDVIAAELQGKQTELSEIESQWELDLPTVGELTLTSRCNNACRFCYMSAAGAADRAAKETELTTAQLCTIIDRFADEIGVRFVIISGGEPTMRPDLPEIISHSRSKGLETVIITNGIRPGLDKEYCLRLAQAGLTSAQVSLECPDEAIHNWMVGNKLAFKSTVQAIHNLLAVGIHAYPNSTLASPNRNAILQMPAFLKERGVTTWSSNGLVRAGRANSHLNDLGLTYTEMAVTVPQMVDAALHAGIKFTWYLPVPNCILPSQLLGYGYRGCTAANTVAIANAKGQLIPCNNMHNEPIGNLLDPSMPFSTLWNSEAALWWRQRQWAPSFCRSCTYAATCLGACPLYWHNGGDLAEIARAKGIALSKNTNRDWNQNFEKRPKGMVR